VPIFDDKEIKDVSQETRISCCYIYYTVSDGL
jgi:hypothetical protein